MLAVEAVQAAGAVQAVETVQVVGTVLAAGAVLAEAGMVLAREAGAEIRENRIFFERKKIQRAAWSRGRPFGYLSFRDAGNLRGF